MGKLRIVGVVAGLVLVSGVVLQVSSAAFTGSATNEGNSWDAGTVSFDDTNPGTALFTATNMKPGDTATQCIEVTYDGSIAPAQAVSFSADVTEVTGGDGTDGLGNDLDVTVRMGVQGQGCLGFTNLLSSQIASTTLAGLETTPVATGWTPSPGTAATMTRAFQITVTLGADTPNTAQGDGADAALTWSATS